MPRVVSFYFNFHGHMPYNYKYDTSHFDPELIGFLYSTPELNNFMEKIYESTNYFTSLAKYDVADYNPIPESAFFRFRMVFGFILGIVLSKLILNLIFILDIMQTLSGENFQILTIISCGVLFALSFLLFIRSHLHKDRKSLITCTAKIKKLIASENKRIKKRNLEWICPGDPDFLTRITPEIKQNLKPKYTEDNFGVLQLHHLTKPDRSDPGTPASISKSLQQTIISVQENSPRSATILHNHTRARFEYKREYQSVIDFDLKKSKSEDLLGETKLHSSSLNIPNPRLSPRLLLKEQILEESENDSVSFRFQNKYDDPPEDNIVSKFYLSKQGKTVNQSFSNNGSDAYMISDEESSDNRERYLQHDLCLSCFTSNKNARLKPCYHLATCKQCADYLVLHEKRCPVCDLLVSDYLTEFSQNEPLSLSDQ